MAFWLVGSLAMAAAVAMVAMAMLLIRQPRAADATQARSRIAGLYYSPMTRLLDGADLEMLPRLGIAGRRKSRFQSSRRTIYRRYLRDLQADFGALHQEARLLLRDSSVDRPDLAVELVKQYCEFHAAVAFAHVSLAAHAVGIQKVDPSSLLAPAQWLRQQTELLVSGVPEAA